jgi:hypothetical protein
VQEEEVHFLQEHPHKRDLLHIGRSRLLSKEQVVVGDVVGMMRSFERISRH